MVRPVLLLTLAIIATGFLAEASELLIYDGELRDGGGPANGIYDFRFSICEGVDASSAERNGTLIEKNDVVVRNGHFTVELEVGTAPPSRSQLWLAIEVARADRLGGFTRLEPLQPLQNEAAKSAFADVPSGAVVFFNLASCPAGWTEHSAARGRAIVGLQPAGTLGGTQGAVLGNLEQRLHTHAFSGLFSTEYAGYHNHIWAAITAVTGGVQWTSYSTSGSPVLAFAWENGIGNDGSGIYPLAAQPNDTLYTSMNMNHDHDVTVPTTATGGASGTLPYLQLLACRKD
jgi:hypothetical protein